MLFRLLMCTTVLTCLASVARAQQPDELPLIPPGDLPYEILNQWNVKCYEYSEFRQSRIAAVGSTVNVFRPAKLGEVLTATWIDARGINIYDDWAQRGDTRRLRVRIYAQTNPYLTVDRICFSTMQHIVRGNREDDVFTYLIDGAPGSEPMFASSLTVGTFMRLVTLLPMEPGRFEPRRILNIPEIELSSVDLPITCHGPETILLRGIENETTKYSYNGYTAWVRNSDRTLLRLEMPDRRFLELLKDGTCCSGERLRKFVDDARHDLEEQERLEAGEAPVAPATPATPPGNPSPF